MCHFYVSYWSMNRKNKKSKESFGIHQRDYAGNKELCHTIRRKYFALINDEWIDNKKVHQMLHNEFKVPLSTLYRWTNAWEKSKHYHPSDMSKNGHFHRIFTDKQEENMANYINLNYMDPGNYFSGLHFQSLAFETYDSIFKDDLDTPMFSCSSSFIQDFKKRNKISSRLAHFRQRLVDLNI